MSQIVFGIRIITDSVITVPNNTYGLVGWARTANGAIAKGATSITLNGAAWILPRTWIRLDNEIIGCIKTVNYSTKVCTFFEGAYVAVSNGATVTTCGEFLWSQTAVSDNTSSASWLGGMITDGGIGPWTRQIDLRYGGNVESNPSCAVTVKNTDQFSQSLADLDLRLIGRRAELWRFDGMAGTFVGVLQKVFECQEPEWSSTEYSIPLLGMQERRRANVGRLITKTSYPKADENSLGNMAPVSFGYMPKRKLINTTKYENIIKNTDIYSVIAPANTAQFPIASNYPEGTAPTLVYAVYIGLSVNASTRTAESFVGKYLRVVAGDHSNGEVRRIASVSEAGILFVVFTLDAYFTETLIGSVDATATGNAWIEIVDIDGTYECDTFKCKSFTDDNGNDIIQGVELYAYGDNGTVEIASENDIVPVKKSSQQYFQLPQYMYDRSADAENNSVDIDAKQFNGTPDQADAFKILPINAGDIELVTTAADFTAMWPSNPYGSVRKFSNGLFAADLGPGDTLVLASIIHDPGAFQNSIDKNSTSFDDASWAMSIGPSGPQKITQAINIKLPACPINFVFDEVYLLISAKSEVIPTPPCNIRTYYQNVYSATRKFMGAPNNIINSDFDYTDYNGNASIFVNDSPDFYFTDSPDNNNKNFYVTEKVIDNSGPVENTLTGKSYWKIPNVSNAAEYRAIEKIMFALTTQVQAYPNTGTTHFHIHNSYYEIAVMFRKSVSIGNEVYSPHKGRIYNSTFESRRTASGMINGPSNILEHVSRLQNYSDLARMPDATYGWGWTYSDAAQIYTGAASGSVTNSFDSSELQSDSVFSLDISNELFGAAEMKTDYIKKSICGNFFIGSFENAAGFEAVRPVKRSSTSSGETITLAQIIDRRSIKITEPQIDNIFCEPEVRYQKNLGSDKMERVIRFKNSSAVTYQAGYVEAEDGLFGEVESAEYWGKCKTLWEKTHQINPMPDDLINLQWANTGDTNADLVAKDFITTFIDWQFNLNVEFKTHMVLVKDWELLHRFNLQLPHQTNNAVVDCVCTKITIDPNDPYTATIRAIIYSETIPSDFYYQDSYSTVVPYHDDSYTDGDEWVDSM